MLRFEMQTLNRLLMLQCSIDFTIILYIRYIVFERVNDEFNSILLGYVKLDLNVESRLFIISYGQVFEDAVSLGITA